MAEMKTLTIGETAYEIVDEKARNEKLDASKLPSAINTALAQAKASGEFDGAGGKDGADGVSPTVAVGKSGKVTTITITDKAGEHTATIKDGNGWDGIGQNAETFNSVNNTADGNFAHAEGFNTKASGNYQHVQGRYNVDDADGEFMHIVGNGSSSSKRKNIHTVDRSGNAWYQGDVYVGSTSGKNRDEGSKKLATEEYVAGQVAIATPVKGVDYFTDADKEEFLQDVGIFEEVGKTSISNNLCDGVYEWGSLESGGVEGSLTPENYGFRTANFLPVEGGKRVMWNADNTTIGGIFQLYCICEYDADKNHVLRTKTISHTLNQWDTNKGIELNANTKYVRFYIYNGTNAVDLDNIKINLFYVENIEEFFTGAGDTFLYVPHLIVESAGEYIPLAKIQSPLTGKKIAYDGDSICIGTYGGGGYAKIIADRVGGTFVNQAVGGARLVTKGSGSFHSIVDNLPNLPTDADLYCFDGGVNDVWSTVPLGTYEMSNYSGEVDRTTICGALETIFRYCLDNFVGKPVCYIITHKVSSISFENYKNYHDAAVAICNKYSIPYYDAYNESGLNGWNTAQNNAFLTGNNTGTPDGCHPNEDGYKRYYVPQLISLFESIMPIE